MAHPLARTALILGLTVIGSYICAIAYVCVMTWTLPPSDGAYGQAPFEDSLVLPVMTMFAAACAVIVGPFALALLWSTDLRRSVPLTFGTALATIAIVTTQSLRGALLGGMLATLFALVLCHWLFHVGPPQRDDPATRGVSPAR